jgi:hypothetical protein
LVAIVAGLLVTFASGASAASPLPSAITDYANYPANIDPAPFPAGCNSQGGSIITGAKYTVNGVTSGTLGSFTLHTGDPITMTWTGFAQGCDGAGVSLAAKATQHPVFVPQDNQKLIVFDYCGPLGASCSNPDGGFGPLTVTVPSREDACNFQIDAVIGPPLAKVGPDGSYYSEDSRSANGKPDGANMLIDANNGGEGKCIIPPQPTAQLSCTLFQGSPGVHVSIANPDDDDTAVVDVLKNGSAVFSGVSVAPLSTETRDIPFANGETATVTVHDTVGGTDVFSQSFTANCLNPAASATKVCADGGVDVHLANEGAQSTASFIVTVDGTATQHDVAGGGHEDFVVPVAEDATVHITITQGDTTFVDDDFTANCTNPAATAVRDCTDGGVHVHLTNTDAEMPVTFDVTVGSGNSSTSIHTTATGTTTQHTVAPGGTEDFVIPVSPGDTIHLTISAGGPSYVDTGFTNDCFKPLASIENVCSADGNGAKITFSNDGEEPVDMTVTKNGTVIDTVTVGAGETTSRTYAMAEDETAVFRITAPAFDTTDQTLTHDCTQVQGVTVTTVSGTELARTGAGDTKPLASLAGLLLMAGGFFLALANWSPAAVAAMRRSRSGL